MCGTLSSLGEKNAAEKGSSKKWFALRLTLKKAAGGVDGPVLRLPSVSE